MKRISTYIKNTSDLLGTEKPSVLFYPTTHLLSHLLSYDPDQAISKFSIRARKILHPILKRISPLFTEYPQVIESNSALPDADRRNQPIILCPNHGFRNTL